MAKIITAQNFQEEVLKSEKPFLVDFGAAWCGPCRMLAPIIDELSQEGYAVGKVDVDQDMALAQQFRVVNVPTMILFKDGREADRLIGLCGKDKIKALFDK